MHNNIGAYASAISDGIDDIENRKLIVDSLSLQNLKNNATEIIASLRNTIWAFNKESITLTGISDRLKIYIHKMQPSYPNVQMILEENIVVDKRLSPVQALHIFRIVQEAIHNALTHSGGDEVIIHLASNDTSIDISVADNGNGFNADAMMNAGNGLNNMKTRAAEAGCVLTFSNQNAKGTIVKLTDKK